MKQNKKVISDFQFKMDIPMTSKRIVIDLILLLTILILPLYSRLVVGALVYWLSIRNQFTEEHPAEPFREDCHRLEETRPPSELYPSSLSGDSGFLSRGSSNNLSYSPAEQSPISSSPPTVQSIVDSFPTIEQSFFNSGSPSLQEEQIPPLQLNNEDSQSDEELLRWNNVDPTCKPLQETKDLNSPSLSKALSPSIIGYMEYFTEENAELKELCEHIGQSLRSNSTGDLCSGRSRFKSEFDRINSTCKKTRSNFGRFIRSYLPYDVQKNYLNHPTVAENVRLLKETKEAMNTLDKEIKEEGLENIRKDPDSVNWPEFSGENLPLLNDFLRTFEELANQVGIQKSEKGQMLMKKTKGSAKYLLSLSQTSSNPTYSELKDILTSNFGSTEKQMEIIERRQLQYGQLPNIHLTNKNTEELYQMARNHLILIEVSERLSQSKNTEETPLTCRHIKHLENLLPRTVKESLAAEGFNSLDNKGKFQEVKKAFQQKEYFLRDLMLKQNYIISGPNFDPRIPPPMTR